MWHKTIWGTYGTVCKNGFYTLAFPGFNFALFLTIILGFPDLVYSLIIPWLKKLTYLYSKSFQHLWALSSPINYQTALLQTACWNDLSGAHLLFPAPLDDQAIQRLRKLSNLGWCLWLSLNSMVMCFWIFNFHEELLL